MVPRARLGIFCGPSLPPEDRLAADGVAYLPPAGRGDVERAAAEFDAVLLIDGVFHQDLAPSPKECYRAVQIARCFGASSMGALRAAECRPYGFVPLGAIARWYVEAVVDGDDEVAVLVDPGTQRALTVPLVNVRYVAWLARRRQILLADECARLIAESREMFYTERTWRDVAELAPAPARNAIRAIAEREGDLKRHDARFALRFMLRTRMMPAYA